MTPIAERPLTGSGSLAFRDFQVKISWDGPWGSELKLMGLNELRFACFPWRVLASGAPL